MFVVSAVHESSSDPIMTEAAFLLSPTANLRLHAFNTHHTHTHTQVATAIFMETSQNAKVTAFLSRSAKTH